MWLAMRNSKWKKILRMSIYVALAQNLEKDEEKNFLYHSFPFSSSSLAHSLTHFAFSAFFIITKEGIYSYLYSLVLVRRWYTLERIFHRFYERKKIQNNIKWWREIIIVCKGICFIILGIVCSLLRLKWVKTIVE